jgi:hypothetical protein
MRHDRNRRHNELRICDKCDWDSVQNEEHICMNIWPASAHNTSLSSYLGMRIAQLISGPFQPSNQMCFVLPVTEYECLALPWFL